MIALQWLHWSGFKYDLTVKRDWRVFWEFSAIFEPKGSGLEMRLPVVAARHISSNYLRCDRARGYFTSSESWWRFSCLLCDAYCERFVLLRPDVDNVFSHHRDATAAWALAREQQGYNGPSIWPDE